MISLAQGKKLIKLARESISCYFSHKDVEVDKVKEEFSEVKEMLGISRTQKIPKEFFRVLGVFVTLNKDEQLRGCIGFPEGVYPLYEGVVKGARSAAFSDPRFVPLDKEELKDIAIEVSVLTKPKKIDVKKAEEYVKKVKVGRDGLIVRSSYGSGLLLPQVATEYKWDSKTFLEQTCVKAGLDRDIWKSTEEVEVYSFQSQVFSEVEPEGEVKQLM